MNKEPIMLINGKVSAADYIKGAAPALKNIPIMVIAMLIGLFCLASSIMDIISKGLSVMPIITMIIALMLVGFTPFLPNFQAKGLYKQLCQNTGVKEGDSIPMRAMLYDDKLVFLTDENAMTLEYTGIKRIYETESTISILTKSRVLIVFPKDGCTGGSYEDALRIIRKGL